MEADSIGVDEQIRESSRIEDTCEDVLEGCPLVSIRRPQRAIRVVEAPDRSDASRRSPSLSTSCGSCTALRRG